MPLEFDSRKYAKTSTHQKEWGDRLISELKRHSVMGAREGIANMVATAAGIMWRRPRVLPGSLRHGIAGGVAEEHL